MTRIVRRSAREPPNQSAECEDGDDGGRGRLRKRDDLLSPPIIPSPGSDGYTTPTGESAKKESEQHTEPGAMSPTENGRPERVSIYHRNIDVQSSRPVSPRQWTPHGFSPRPFVESIHSKLEEIQHELAWAERMRHFTWSYFTITMATGGIANVLYSVPFRFNGLTAIGTIFFILNFVLFLINCVCITSRFILYPSTFKMSLTHPTESLFVPAAVVSFGTILLNISQYGVNRVGPWLNDAVVVLFWIDTALAIISSCGTYLIIWSTQTFTIRSMTPIWIFPAYPLLIIGPHAGILIETLDAARAKDIMIGGFVVQGIGYMVSLTMYSSFIYRLMTQKLPRDSLRPGMFVSVGPSGFTAAGVINMASNAESVLSPDFMGDGRLAAQIIRIVGNWASLWTWGLAAWFFFVCVVAHWKLILHKQSIPFAMTWYSFVFPNTALITATFAVGKAFEAKPLQWIGCVLTCVLIVVWFFVTGMFIRAIKRKEALWPQKGEDRDEGGFKLKEYEHLRLERKRTADSTWNDVDHKVEKTSAARHHGHSHLGDDPV